MNGYFTIAMAVLFALSGRVLGDDSNNANSPLRFEYRQIEMGVEFRIVLYGHDKVAANNAATAAFERIRELNGVLSDYDPKSELRKLCESSRPGMPVSVSADLFRVLKSGCDLSTRTNGAFDVTLGHLTRLWRRARRRLEMPDEDQLRKALMLSGYRHVRLDRRHRCVELGLTKMRLDLGGIAKGYAADEALIVLASRGFFIALVDGSGDIAVGNSPPGSDGWKIAISRITPERTDSERMATVSNCGIATSGDAFQSVEIGGRRYSHILDPKTGLGLNHRSSVTVIAPNGMESDSLASAVSVLGPEAGIRLINGLDKDRYAAFVTFQESSAQDDSTAQFKVTRSASFDRLSAGRE